MHLDAVSRQPCDRLDSLMVSLRVCDADCQGMPCVTAAETKQHRTGALILSHEKNVRIFLSLLLGRQSVGALCAASGSL